MTGNLSKNVKEYNHQLRSTPNKFNSPVKENNFENVNEKKVLRSTPVKTTPTIEKLNLRNKNQLNEKELSFCLDLNEQLEYEDSSGTENEETISIKPVSKAKIALWRISESPITKTNSSPSHKHKTTSGKMKSPSERIRNMSPDKSEQQLNKVRRSLNMELGACGEQNLNNKSHLKITLKRKVIESEDKNDASPAKSARIKLSTPVKNIPATLETPPSVKRKLRAREDLKLPLWRRVELSSPLKEIQSIKVSSLKVKKCETPQKQNSEPFVHTPESADGRESFGTPENVKTATSITPVSKKKPTKDTSFNTPKSNKKESIEIPVNYIGCKTYGTPVSRKLEGRGFLTPTMAEKQKNIQTSTPQSPLDQARVQLHISTVPKSLPCREKEFNNINSFIKRKINDHAGGCMYISGVPGTGKTATVHTVVRSLQQLADVGEISPFDFIEVNGLRLTEPRQAYVRILQTLTGQKLTAEQAQRILDKRFSGNTKRSTVLLVDELDYLCNRRQDVVYNILDWPSKRNSGLVVLTISNTMDLPERTLKGRVTSRMGLTRLMFQPYTHHQLQAIVLDRLAGNKSFHPDAVQLVARKVAAVSGDARRALDICRRATELVSGKNTVTVSHIESALTQIFTGPRVLAIRSCSKMEQLVLRALRDETQRTGVDESNVRQVYIHLVAICSLEDCPTPNTGDLLRTCTSLADSGLIVTEKGRPDIMRKLSLNVSSDDIHFALDC